MKPQKLLDLVNASQAVIQSKLLSKAEDNKYDLLMLLKSFEVLGSYIANQQQVGAAQTKLLERYYTHHLVDDYESVIAQLASDLRDQVTVDHVFELLEALNNEELKITEPKAVQYD